MFCDVCGKNQAIIYYEERINNKVRKMHLCSECAMKEGVSNAATKPFFNISDLFSSICETTADKEICDTKQVCNNCGTTYEQFIEAGLFGCCQCYSYFERSLQPLFRRIHGATHHIGKTYSVTFQPANKAEQINELNEKLQQAVASEEFEQAALFRDQIRELRRQSDAEDEKADDNAD